MVPPVRIGRALTRGWARYLACNDEPYSLELVEGGRPGHDHVAFELHSACSLDDASAHLESKGVTWRAEEGCLFVADPDGRSIQLMPHRPSATENERWPQHARASTSVHLGGPRRLGHVNTLTGDLRANAAFYTDVLEMRVSDLLGDDGSGSASAPSITSWRWSTWLRALPPPCFRARRHRKDARPTRSRRPARAVGRRGGRHATASAGTSPPTSGSPRRSVTSSSTATWSSSPTTTCRGRTRRSLYLEHLGAVASALVLPLRSRRDRVRA